jgi:hypothetical protein
VFNKEWEEQYFVTDVEAVAVCLVFGDTASVSFSVLNPTVLENSKDIVPLYLGMQEQEQLKKVEFGEGTKCFYFMKQVQGIQIRQFPSCIRV